MNTILGEKNNPNLSIYSYNINHEAKPPWSLILYYLLLSNHNESPDHHIPTLSYHEVSSHSRSHSHHQAHSHNLTEAIEVPIPPKAIKDAIDITFEGGKDKNITNESSFIFAVPFIFTKSEILVTVLNYVRFPFKGQVRIANTINFFLLYNNGLSLFISLSSRISMTSFCTLYFST